MKDRRIESGSTGRRIPIDEAAKYSKDHSDGLVKSEENRFPPKDPLRRLELEPLPEKKNSVVGSVIIGVILISVGLSILLGIGKYWPIIPISLGLVFILEPFIKRLEVRR